MDWYVDTTDPDAAGAVRGAISAYLHRHSADPDTVPGAEVIVSELLGNVVRHAPGPTWVSLTWAGEHPRLSVYDLGPGFTLDPHLPADPLAEGGRGLYIVSHLADKLTAAARRGGGTLVSATLHVPRAPEQAFDPPRRVENVLPALNEAGEAGFGKEAFLRALVVQLAQHLDATHGPAAAHAAVAQVGADVGGQMEAEYRAAHEVVGTLSPKQIADCYLRLKHAIDGGFYLIEAGPERIVLGNHRCPFGEAVRAAPALCRMTSSVFGGIAAHNHSGTVDVLLEERIAVGDPGCRVIVALHPAEAPATPGVHRYRNPRTTATT